MHPARAAETETARRTNVTFICTNLSVNSQPAPILGGLRDTPTKHSNRFSSSS
jgi:hypothetical protein